MKILLIDDDPLAAMLLRALVRELHPGWMLLDAQQGIDGLALAKTERPDVVLLDSLLPNMSGAAVLTALRQDAATSEVPVLVVSADARPETREQLLGLGANRLLLKPYDIDEIIAQIEALLLARAQSSRRLGNGAGELENAS